MRGELGAGRSTVPDVVARCRAGDRVVPLPGGGTSHLLRTPVERFDRDARLFRLHGGTSEARRVVVHEAGSNRG